MYTSLLLALPLLAPVLGHTIPKGHHANALRAHTVETNLEERALRDAAAVMALTGKRAIPKAHFGFAPSSPENVENAAGFYKRQVEERNGPKAHFGFPPSAGTLENAAGFAKRDGMKLVRRRKNSKRACKAKTSSAALQSPTPTSSLGGGLIASSTPSAYSHIDSSSAVTPTTTSSVSLEPSSTFSSAAQPSQTSANTNSAIALVFPQGRGVQDWTTVVDQTGSMSFDDALKPLSAGKLPTAGSAPDGSNALIASYPAGTVKLASGQGYSFYSSGDKAGINIQGAKEVMFSYSVYFQEGFQFVKGGKLPGLYGGTSFETAKSCSGGRQDGRNDCFSARLMWRTDGAGEIYNYLPSAAYTGSYCSTPPFSKCDPAYGESIGRGAFTFPTGQWVTLAMRLKMNDANVANGEQELFVNGKSVIRLTDLMISVNSETKIYGIMAQTFFGGSDSSWASPIDQSAYFKDWSLAVLS